MAGLVGLATFLEQEPGSPLGLIDKVFQKARGGDVLVIVANLVARAHGRDDLFIVAHQLAQHVAGGHTALVIVLDALQLGNLADRPQGDAADLAHAFGDIIGRGENLLGLLVEQQMIVAEMRAADVPVEILGLDVERERGARISFIFADIRLTASAERSVGVSSGAAGLRRVSRARTLLFTASPSGYDGMTNQCGRSAEAAGRAWQATPP